MIDLNHQPDSAGVAVDGLPSFIVNAVNHDYPKQRTAINNLKDVEKLGVDHLHFVNQLRELWLQTDQDKYSEEFNSLLYFLSSIAKCCGDTAALVEQDREYAGWKFADSRQNAIDVAQLNALYGPNRETVQ